MKQGKVTYRLGDRVRIKTGPFAAFTGKIEGINQAKTMLNVKVEIYGRRTPIKLSFWEAERLEFEPPDPSASSKD